MVHLDTMGEVALFKTRLHQRRLDHEAQERSRTDAQTHREHLNKYYQLYVRRQDMCKAFLLCRISVFIGVIIHLRHVISCYVHE